MGVSSSAVEIRINVVDTNTQQVIAQTKNGLDQLGNAGAGAASKMKTGMKEAEAGTLSMHQKTHLLTEELGIHIPRAFLRLIGTSKTAEAVINSLSSAMIGLGAIQIGAMVFTQLIDGAKKLWDEHLSLTKAANDYYEEVEKTRNQEFGNSHSIETTMLRINDATEAIKKFKQESEEAQKPKLGWRNVAGAAIPGGGIWQYLHQRSQASEAEKNAIEQQKQLDKLQHSTESAQYHEQMQTDIAHRYAGNAGIKDPKAKYDATIKEARDRAAEERRYANEQDKLSGNPVAANAGADKEKMAVATATIKADAELANAQKTHDGEAKRRAEELQRIHEQALESGLTGSALYAAQEAHAIDELKEKGIATAQAIDDVHTKFHNEQMKRYKAQEDEIAKMREATQLAGLTGTARLKQEETNKIHDLMRDSKGANPGQLLAKINEIHQETARQIGEVNKSFAERVDEISMTAAERELTGFAKIRADAQKQIAALTKEFHEKGGNQADLDRGVGAINASAGGQEAELRRRNIQETEQIEAEAHAKSLSDEKNKSAAIYAQYDERVRKYQEQLDRQAISEEDFNRRVAAAGELRDAEMVQASKEAHDKMAGEFDSLFKSLDHPMNALRQMGEKVAANYAATLVQKFQQHGAGAGTTDSGISGIFGSMINGHGFGGKNAMHPAAHTASANKVMALQSATIHIQSASIYGGGSVASGTRGGGEYGTAGGTSLLSSGGVSSGSTAGGTSLLSSGGVSSGSTAGAGAAGASFGGSGSTGGVGAPGAGVASAMGMAGAGFNFAKDASNALGGKDSPIAKLADSKMGQKLGGIASAGMGLFSAFEGNGGVGGAIQGGMSGMKLGSEIGGPLGAAIGLIGGAIMGAFGFGGRSKAEAYYNKNVKPRLGNDMDSFQQGGMDYLTAFADMTALDMEAKKATNAMGPSAQNYYQDTIKSAIKQSEEKLTREQKAGRSASTFTASQFDVGGPIGGFGAMTTDSDHGWIHAQRGEFMVHQAAAMPHYQALQAINGGASHSDMAQYYGGGRGEQMMPTESGDTTHNWTVHATDSKSFADMLRNNPNALRSALNLSQEQYGGIADA